jgi:DNA-binding transcriptional ArsR family regulator
MARAAFRKTMSGARPHANDAIANPRGRILLALLDGRGLPASELARRVGITRQTASSHLARLVEGNLLRVIPQGRHRYYRITNTRVAELLELMANMVPRPETDFSQARPRKKSGRVFARQCIDWSERRNHLAGALGSALADRLFDLGWIKRAADCRAVRVTELGHQELERQLGLVWPPQRRCDVASGQ